MTAQGQQHSTADELFLPAIHAYLSGFQVQPRFYGPDAVLGVWSSSRIKNGVE